MQNQITYEDVADYFLALANETGESITNLKLQKLVYYAQAWSLAIKNKELFNDDFQAWVHGPVLPDLYHKYKSFGYLPINKTITIDEVKTRIDKGTFGFLEEVAKVYMKYGAYEMEMMTHREAPWVEARKNHGADENCENIISKNSMRNFYGERAKEKENQAN